jgi:hypothetical protein
MEKQMIKKHIDIDGLILTDAAIERLKAFQHSNNELGKVHVSNIADTICYLELLCSHELSHDPELISKAREAIDSLIDVREDLKYLQKP